MVNYVLAGAARTQAAAMIQELETTRPGALERLAHGALAELKTWPEQPRVVARRSTARRPS